MWTVVNSTITTLSYAYGPVEEDIIYNLRISARNIYGYSLPSNIVAGTPAKAPSAVDVPVGSTIGPSLVIIWNYPVDNGSPITKYKIFLR